MLENLIPMVVMTGMFAMIFGIVYIRSRENMAMIERGLNPRNKDPRPRPFINLKWGLLLIGSGLGLLFAFIIDNTILKDKTPSQASITIGGHHRVGRSATNITDTSHAGKDTSLAAHNVSVKIAGDDDGEEDDHSIAEVRNNDPKNVPIYFALIAIGGGLGLFFSYRIEKKEWVDKKMDA